MESPSSADGPLSEILDKPEFRQRLGEWLAYKKERRQSYKPQGFASMLSVAEPRVVGFGMPAVLAAMQKAIANHWQGWDQESSFKNIPKVAEDPTPTKADAEGYNGRTCKGLE